MKRTRFYYLTDNLDDTVDMVQGFEAVGIPHKQIHVLGKNDGGLVRHKINEGSPLEVYDIVHMGEEGAIIGCVIGFICAMALWVWSPYGIQFTFWMVLPVWILFTLHGAWSGGLIGTHARNYRIRPFLKALEAGKFLTMVDVNEAQAEKLNVAEKALQVFPSSQSATGSSPLEEWSAFRVTQSEWPKVRR